ncbi:uncharacterized protein N7473_012841 [Penicillium subrubescens]|uniref:uncharacterized protein n=1 Tax=Penicillium subrubescens TaxID=1316194 RepID=UPI0025451EE1|nr:uncharacterized protein N7473_012841 [Penicillium subrubescens]KAJ5875494.1 hypothetical protein N7473_012841 [Penicillium subrubescens]
MVPTTPLPRLYEVRVDHDDAIRPEEIADAMNKLLDHTKITSLHEDECISAWDPLIMRKIAYLELRERGRLARVQDLRDRLGDLYGTGTAGQTMD